MPSQTESPTGGATPTTAPPSPHPTTADGDRVLNSSVRDDERGVRLRLNVDGDLSYASGDDILLELVVTNTGEASFRYDPGEPVTFFLTPAGSSDAAWWNGRCSGLESAVTGPAELAPGEEVRFGHEYPGPDGRGRCDVAPGEYDVYGQVASCPDGAVVAGDGGRGERCDRERTVKLVSLPVTIRIG